MTGALVPLDTLGATISAHVAKGDKAAGKAEEHYMSAGLRMVEAKRRVEAESGSFRAFLEHHGIGRSRAYDILAVAEGKKTFAGIRAKGAERAARHAQQNRLARGVSVTNGQVEPETVSAASSDVEVSFWRDRFWKLNAIVDGPTRDRFFNTVGTSALFDPMAEIEVLRADNASLATERDQALAEVERLKRKLERLEPKPDATTIMVPRNGPPPAANDNNPVPKHIRESWSKHDT